MRIVPTGHALSSFFALTFTLCMIWGLIVPMHVMMGDMQVTIHMHEGWSFFMPGFHWSFFGYLIGLAWAYFYGWYIAFVFVPIYKFFNRRAA